ncbi:MAG: hypothetical protein M1816_004227 [Peltula sp. TS41687]|nr:MAG: hypothetical protein M1816_004227 [Peltula sp. TS41687]
MKISIIITTWSATLSLGLPIDTPKASTTKSTPIPQLNEKNQNAKSIQNPPKSNDLDLPSLSVAYIVGVALAGGGSVAFHRWVVNNMDRQHREEIEQLTKDYEARMVSHGRWKAIEARDAAYMRGKEDARPTEDRHKKLLKCFNERLPLYRNVFPHETEAEYEDLVWSLCRTQENIELQDPAFTWGPHKTGFDLIRPRVQLEHPPPPPPPQEGTQPQPSENQGSTPPPPSQGDQGPGGPQISPFSYVKNGVMNKAQNLGQNFARIVGAAAKSTTSHAPNSAGSIGGLRVPAPVVGGGMAVSPLR